jgi:hypothetical protein
MGIVGGDLLKAVVLARQQAGRRAQAVATVAVDRMIGLYVLFVVAAIAVLALGLPWSPDKKLRLASYITLGLTLVGGLGIAMLFIPGITQGRLSRRLAEVPRIGHIIASLIEAVRMYRQRTGVLVGACLISIAVHSCFTIGCYFIACGLYETVLPLSTHFVVMPISASTGAIPLVMGPFEFVLEFLYMQVPAPEGVTVLVGQGLIVALCYRIITVLIAAVGICYYLTSRAELAKAIEEAEQEPATEVSPEIDTTLFTVIAAERG